ncbi:MAG: hypothetical protein L0I76_16280 [Pseudonocardia sp.]|nr:hypothetical protein [Pseudonocardia sp.]
MSGDGRSLYVAPEDESAPLDDLQAEAPLNPVETEAGIRKCARMIHKGIRIVSDAEWAYREADAKFDRAFAAAYLDHDGPAHAKKYAAELNTQPERDDRDVKELAFRYADRRQRALLAQLDAIRSVNTSVRAAYMADSGVGR